MSDRHPTKRPRVTPLTADELDEHCRELLTLLMPSSADHPLAVIDQDQAPQIAATLIRHPSLFEAWAPMVLAVTGGALPFRGRELVLLRTAALTRGAYVWSTHATIAVNAGLTSEDITRTGSRVLDGSWSDQDASLLSAVDQLHTEGTIDDPTWERLSRHYDTKALIEIPMIAGFSRMVAYVTNSLGVLPDPWMEPAAPFPWATTP